MPSRPGTRKLRVAVVAVWLALALGTAWWMSPRDHGSVGAEASRLHRAGRAAEAAAVLRSATAAERRDPAVLEVLGGVERDLGRAREAEQAFATALRLDPARIEARLGLASALLARGANVEAAQVLVAADVPATSTVRQRWLALMAQAGQPDLLATAADRVLAQDPNDVGALSRALDAAMQRHRWPQAITFGLRLATLDPARREATLVAVATAQEASGDLAAAYETLSRIDDPTTWRAQARIASALGRFREVSELWQRHPDEVPTVEERTARAWAFQQTGLASAADTDYRMLMSQGALTPEARVRYAWWLAERGQRAEASRVAAGLPVTASTLELLTFTAAWAGDDERAAVLLPDWLARHPRDAAAWALLAEVSRRRGESDTRTRALAQLAALDPAQAATHLALARQLASAGQIDQAIAAYERATRTPGSAEGLEELVALLEQQARTREAIAQLQRLETRVGPSADRLAQEARLWRRVGDPRAAVESWRRALAARPQWADDPAVQAEVARAYAEAGDWAPAAAAIAVALRAPADADLWRVAADIETHRGQPGRAVDHLLSLARHRSLTPDERRWLAGQAEAAQRIDVALAEYDRLLAVTPSAGALWQKWRNSRRSEVDTAPPSMRGARCRARRAARATGGSSRGPPPALARRRPWRPTTRPGAAGMPMPRSASRRRACTRWRGSRPMRSCGTSGTSRRRAPRQ
jgi:tetratricopeptide (TPR) repeat protein